jgi:HEPN domain-containing protein
MSGVEHAREMVILAQRDLKALQGMFDADTFADEIFGFHAQQAVEKALKAWLTVVGVEYPRTHDLEELLGLLEEHAEPILEAFYDLVDLTDFAVQFRYRIFEDAEGRLNRRVMIQQVDNLVVHVERLVQEAEQAG